MDAYETLKRQLRPTGLYALGGGTVVDFELKAYAAGLNPVYDSIAQLQAESFLPTASDYGLELFGEAFGIPQAGTADQRRAALLTISAVTPGRCTVPDLENVLSAAGLSVKIEEDISNQKLTVHFLKEPDCGRDAAQKALVKFCPAHLVLESDFSGVS